jgi:group I intron endonuclease
LKSDWIEYGLKTTDSGVYMIKNITNGKVYIGSAVHLIERLSSHFYSLRNNKHHSIHLQNAWNLNIYHFVCGVIEFVQDKSQLKIIEQKYIDKYNSANDEFGYNICPIARNNLGCKQTRGMKEKSERMIGSKNHFFDKHHTPEALHKISESNKFRKLSNDNVSEIRYLWNNSGYEASELAPVLATIFGVQKKYIISIVNNKKRIKNY